MRPLHPLTSGEPDEVDLELLQLGAIDDPLPHARVEAAAQGDLSRAAAEMDAYRAFFSEHAPGLPQAPPSWALPRWVAPVLLAALLLLTIGLLTPGPDEPGYRAKGGLPVDVAVVRAEEPVTSAQGFEPGDQVFLRFVSPSDGYVDVFTVQDDGAVSVLVESAPSRAAERFVLPGAVQLDAHDGREWLVVQLVDQVSPPEFIEQDGQELLPDPGAHATERRWVLDVTRAR